jgi:hypothetical protein
MVSVRRRVQTYALLLVVLLVEMADAKKKSKWSNRKKKDHTPDTMSSLYVAVGVVALFVLPGLIPWSWFTAEPLKPKDPRKVA